MQCKFDLHVALQCNVLHIQTHFPGATLMPRQTADAQLTFRAETPMKVELEAIAATLDRSSAKLLRDILAEALPRLRQEADAEVKKREKLPHGITEDELDKALNSLLRKFTVGEAVHLEQQDLLSPESKAVWVLLSYIWGDHPTDAERQAAAEATAALVGTKPTGARRHGK
jgi:hypothetical protein